MQWIWLGLVVLFAVIELCTNYLTTIWFAIAALVMVFLSLLLEGLSLPAQVLIFLAISALLFFFTRPIAVRKLKVGKTKTNVDSLAGQIALVVRTISEFEKGEVKVSGLLWAAVSEDGREIAAGSKCEILRVEGVKLIVRRVTAPENGAGQNTENAEE